MTASHRVATAVAERVRITQITDVHLFAEDSGELLGLNTQESFEAVLSQALAETTPTDLVLVTGDLAQEPCPASYARLAQGFERFAKPVFSLPGNHDSPALIESEFRGQHIYPHKQILASNWQILMLDSSVPGKVYGMLGDDELKFLDNCLAEFPDHHALVAIHHQPVAVGARWLDSIGLRNSEAFFDVLVRHPQVRIVLWGHVHQEFETRREGISLLSTPSSCVQFKPGSTDFSAGVEDPGYRVLDLYRDGSFHTEVRRIEHMEFTVDYTIKGY